MSARELLLRCLALSEQFEALEHASNEQRPEQRASNEPPTSSERRASQQYRVAELNAQRLSSELLSAELLTAVGAWFANQNATFSTVDDGHAYSRRELYRDSVGEILAMRWRPGRFTAPHDHAEARGLVFLLDQEFTERRFDFAAQQFRDGQWQPGVSHLLQAPLVLKVSAGVVHDMCCAGAGTSIHVYFPCITGMRVFDIPGRTIWHVSAEAGAWVPDQPSQVIRSEHW
jgi:predicted metal-dependent enzyme (double-stranded beta helix superfamily)